MEFAAAGVRPQDPVEAPPIHEWRLPDGTPWTRFHRTSSGYLLRFPDLADFEVSEDGASVRGWAAPGVPDESVRHLYLNQVLPLALSKRGRLVFHASAVETTQGAIAFMGASGCGKSTLAASFATHGWRFLADDGLVLAADGDAIQALPSHPSLRLWDDSRDVLIAGAAPAAPAAHFTRKGRFLAGDALVFCDTPRPLRQVYFLGPGTAAAVTIEALAPAAAAIELVRHSFLIDIAARELLAAHFERLSGLAARGLCFRLDYPRSYAALAEVRRAILAHCGEPA